MTTLDQNDGYAVLINTFVVEPERAEALLAVLHEASATMRRMPGFVSANLHLNGNATRIVNYVQWRTQEDFEAMLRNKEAQPHMKAAADLADSYDPVTYTLRFSDEA